MLVKERAACYHMLNKTNTYKDEPRTATANGKDLRAFWG